MSKERRQYTKEFKQEAVQLYESSGKSMAEIERDLGMSKGLLKQWMRQAKELGSEAFPGQGRQPALEEELRRLRRENDVLRQEREILKKALGIVSDKPRKRTSS
jgi:transposase